MAGSIGYVVKQNTFADLPTTRGYTDAEMTRLIAAFQSAANTANNGTATRVQVWAFILQWVTTALTNYVAGVENQAAVNAVVIPAPLNPS